MSVIKRSIMTMYSGALDIYSHKVRIVLAEKGVNVDVISLIGNELPEDLIELNPYNTIPTLIDRDLVLYETKVIMEYLDERFPHPPLLPVYPIARAKCRLLIYRVEQDWYQHYHTIIEGGRKADKARKELRDSIVSIMPVFAEAPYFLSEDFTLVDCCIAPLFWRLQSIGVELPKRSKHLCNYMQRIYERPAFQASLSDAERDLQETDEF